MNKEKIINYLIVITYLLQLLSIFLLFISFSTSINDSMGFEERTYYQIVAFNSRMIYITLIIVFQLMRVELKIYKK